jgi:succinate-acetate transporter protein
MSIVQKLANPAPLGLLGFGLTTVLLNLHNAGLFPLDTMILAMGLAYGGLAQVIVGIMEFKKGNTFGTVAFTSYGLFWWSLVGLFVIPRLSFFNVAGLTAIAAPTNTAMAAYFFMWGLFTFAMFFGTLKSNRGLQFVFISLAILFFMLTIRNCSATPSGSTHRWNRRCHMRRKRSLPCVSRSTKRSEPKNCPANLPNKVKTPNSFFYFLIFT